MFNPPHKYMFQKDSVKYNSIYFRINEYERNKLFDSLSNVKWKVVSDGDRTIRFITNRNEKNMIPDMSPLRKVKGNVKAI